MCWEMYLYDITFCHVYLTDSARNESQLTHSTRETFVKRFDTAQVTSSLHYVIPFCHNMAFKNITKLNVFRIA